MEHLSKKHFCFVIIGSFISVFIIIIVTYFNNVFIPLGNEHIITLSKLKQQLQALSLNIPVTNTTNFNESAHLLKRDNIKNEIETILAAECLFCGENMINQIDKPFIEDWDRVNLDWQ